jgi:hypothetical protein
MGLPALILSDPSAATRLLQDVDPEVLERLRDEGRRLSDDIRQARPTEGSPDEHSLLLQMADLSLLMLRFLGSRTVELLREGVNTALSELVRKELAAAEPERKELAPWPQPAQSR